MKREPHPTDHEYVPDAEDISMCGICGWEEVSPESEALADLEELQKRVGRVGVRSIGTGFVEERIAKAIAVFKSGWAAPQAQEEPSAPAGDWWVVHFEGRPATCLEVNREFPKLNKGWSFRRETALPPSSPSGREIQGGERG